MPRDPLNPPSGAFNLFTGLVLFVILLGGYAVVADVGESPEERARVLRIVVGSLSVFTAFLWWTVRRLRHELDVTEDLLSDVRFGKGTKRDRDAIDILVRALRAPDGNVKETALRSLRKITGHDLGGDPTAWEGWWAGARSTFSRTSGAKKSPGGD